MPYPDVLAIDEKLKRLYIASESGVMSSFDISDPSTPTPLGDVLVGEGAHSVAVDPETHRLFFGLAKSGSQSVLRGSVTPRAVCGGARIVNCSDHAICIMPIATRA
jgi:hypothetical protein